MLSASSAVASARAGLSFTSRTPCSVHSTDDMSVGIALMVLSRRPPTAAASTLSPRRSGRKPGARAVKQVARRPGRASPRSCRSNEEVGEVAHGLLVVLRSVPRVGDTERQHGRLALVGGAHSGSAKLSASRHGSRPGPTSARPAARRRRTGRGRRAARVAPGRTPGAALRPARRAACTRARRSGARPPRRPPGECPCSGSTARRRGSRSGRTRGERAGGTGRARSSGGSIRGRGTPRPATGACLTSRAGRRRPVRRSGTSADSGSHTIRAYGRGARIPRPLTGSRSRSCSRSRGASLAVRQDRQHPPGPRSFAAILAAGCGAVAVQSGARSQRSRAVPPAVHLAF
jgi:hypothetical protein